MRKVFIAIWVSFYGLSLAGQPVGRILFNDGWTFSKDGESRILDLPHDWGVEGPFRQEYPCATGKLSWWGHAVYRKQLVVDADDLQKNIRLEVDGAMSGSFLLVNGRQVASHPYGYTSWATEISPWLSVGENQIEIVLDNPEESSRWYPGGGIYRNVWIVKSEKTSVAHWGTFITSKLTGGDATVTVQTKLHLSEEPKAVTVSTTIGSETQSSLVQAYDGMTVTHHFSIPSARLWSPDNPELYTAVTEVVTSSGTKDSYYTTFGIRYAEWRAEGFYLNGEKTFLKGVCLHHDAGALGAVWNTDAWVRRLLKLKEMGCNAIRTSHNPPAPELLDLCDSMGFLVIDELTDTWTLPKKKNDYASLFDEWVEKDLLAMIHRDRNHPSVIAWSIGNECGEQGDTTRWWIPQMLTDICHREDPTRPTTAGNDNPWAAMQPYVGTMDVYGLNYKPHLYAQFRETHPGKPFYGSETASCISTRGYYRFPVSEDKSQGWEEGKPHQVSSFDLYAPSWASSPDYEWRYEDEVPEFAGEFVWTGYDYLGEPTPYIKDMESSPSRSSYFGIMDLAGIPKDRFWLYQSRWNPSLPVVHILPHWTWPGREGEVMPVFVYTNGDEVELFLNGVSLGRKPKLGYRIRWDDVVYRSGTLKAVAYKNGEVWGGEEVRTAGKARRIELKADYVGEDLVYVIATIVDSKGTVVPQASNLITFSTMGPARIIATDAGDPTSHRSFRLNVIPAFHGMASAIIRRGQGAFTVYGEADGLKRSSLVFIGE